jgi:hypothetical protein
MLGYNGAIKVQKKGNTLTITPPALTPDVNPSEYAWVFKISGAL